MLLPIAAALLQATGSHGVRVVADLDYVPEAAYEDDRDKLDLYLPEGRSGFPVVIWFHGGGLVGGSKAGAAHVGRTLAGAGVGAVVANYRLSPGVTHPAHVQDAARVIDWARRHVKEHGGDPKAIFVGGHSAGAYLAALVALDGRYLAAHGIRPTELAGVIPVSAFFWVEEVAPSRPKAVWGGDPAEWPAASPASYFRSAAPPFLIVYADGDEDWRRDQNRRMAAALRKARRGGAELREVKGRDHLTIAERIAPGEEVAGLITGFVAQVARSRR